MVYLVNVYIIYIFSIFVKKKGASWRQIPLKQIKQWYRISALSDIFIVTFESRDADLLERREHLRYIKIPFISSQIDVKKMSCICASTRCFGFELYPKFDVCSSVDFDMQARRPFFKFKINTCSKADTMPFVLRKVNVDHLLV